jgi:hypothetical protein
VLTRLGEALAQWSPAAAPRARDPLALLAAGWTEIAGDDVAKHSCPTRLIEGTLTITTRSSAWSHQLSLLSEQILAAVKARLPGMPLTRLRFRVGPLPRVGNVRVVERTPAFVRPTRRPRAQGAGAQDALKQFRDDVDASGRAKRAAGWQSCARCGALTTPCASGLCAVCRSDLDRERADEVARLLYEAPWLGYAGTAALIRGLSLEEYEAIRSRLLASWWETLSRARAAKRVPADSAERSIASSYVILHSQLSPEAIAPATVRNVLGDELHDLIYGMEPNNTNVQ